MPVLKPLAGDNTDAPKQHTQPSRKGKKAWRKNVDVTKVQKGLEDLNEEIIRGGVIREKDSADLFAIDIKRNSNASKNLPRKIKTLKADDILNQRSAVPPVSMRKRPGDKTTNGLLPVKKQRTDWVSQKELARLRRVADGQHDTVIETKDATYDLWDVPEKPKKVNVNDFIPNEEKAKIPTSMKRQPISLVATGKHVPAVQEPSGGYSYNPTFSDYEKRLSEEGQKAMEAEQARLDREEAERLKQEAAARSAAEAEAAEAKADMSEWEEDSEWEGFQSGAEDENARPTVKRPERKTQAQRNKTKRRKEEERQQKHKAAMKARRIQEAKIKELAEEVDASEASNKQLVLAPQSSDSESEVDNDKLRRRQLGKYKLPEKDLELVLPDELQDSLRLLKPEGNLLKDRYRSMLVRGKIESRRHIPFKKQAKNKLTEKWTYKDFQI